MVVMSKKKTSKETSETVDDPLSDIPEVMEGEGVPRKKPPVRETKPATTVPEKPAKPDLKKGAEYDLIPKYARAVIKPKGREMVYELVEPPMSEEEQKLYDRIQEGLIDLMNTKVELVERDKMKYIASLFNEVVKRMNIKLTPEQANKLMYYMRRGFVGMGKVEGLMHDPNIEDVSCDGVGIPIYIVHKDFGPLKTNIIFHTLNELEAFVIKLSQKCGRFISYGEPLLDGMLDDGSRINATFGAGVTIRGPTFNVRKFREIPFTPLDLIALKTFSADAMAYLWICVERGLNILITGGTATGKSTALNAVSLFIPQNLKIISIEDTAELNLMRENWIQSVSRPGIGPAGGGEGGGAYGQVSMFDLLKASFRQRPDYVIVGEVRGKEATVLFQGMSSGHPALGTIHAQSVETVVERLSTPPINLPPTLIGVLDVLVVMTHTPAITENARRIKEITEILEGKTLRTNAVFKWNPSKDDVEYTGESTILRRVMGDKKVFVDVIDAKPKRVGSLKELESEMYDRSDYLKLMLKKGISFMDFPTWIVAYKEDSEKATEMLNKLPDKKT
jgi:flagellar protein FlaI